jgi:hypothetical protein
MPKPTLDQQQAKIDGLKQTLAEKSEGMEAAELRDLKKKIRRAQRKHHRGAVEAERIAAKPAKKDEKTEAKPEAKAEEPAAKPEAKAEEPAEEKKEEAGDTPAS